MVPTCSAHVWRVCARKTLEHTAIVVDQGSSDGSADLVRKQHPEARLLVFPDNAGFTGGVNRGIRPALEQGFEYIVLLNNDAVPDRLWLERWSSALIVSRRPELCNRKSAILMTTALTAPGIFTRFGPSLPRGRGEEDTGQYDALELQELFSASGRGYAVPGQDAARCWHL
jgi:hypothetical protein